MYGKNKTPYNQWNAYVQHVRWTRRSLQRHEKEAIAMLLPRGRGKNVAGKGGSQVMSLANACLHTLISSHGMAASTGNLIV